jgi:hypothetical protein
MEEGIFMTIREQVRTQIDILPEQMLEKVMNFIQQNLAAPTGSVLATPEYWDIAETDSPNDIAAYDKAKANDDGYRISASDLRKKYGL